MSFLSLFKKDPFSKKLSEAANAAKRGDHREEERILFEILKSDDRRTDEMLSEKMWRYRIAHMLCDIFEHHNELKIKIETILHSGQPRRLLDDPIFLTVALSRLSRAEGYDQAIDVAHQWKRLMPPGVREPMEALRTLYIRNRDFDNVAIISSQLFSTEEKEFSTDDREYYQTFTPSAQIDFVNSERCECGALLESQQHINRDDEQLSEYRGICPSCKKEHAFLFSLKNQVYFKEIEKFAKELGL